MYHLQEFLTLSEEPGTIQHVHYLSHAYAISKVFKEPLCTVEKSMYVYLPFQYDTSRSYNVLFLMHGGTEDEGFWFGKGRYHSNDIYKYGEFGNQTKNLLDNLISRKLIEPLIVITPSFCENLPQYQAHPQYGIAYFETTNTFWMELKNDILPFVLTHYATYAASSDEKDLRNARDHFAFAGASQGSIITFESVMFQLTDYFSYYGNYSAGVISVRPPEYRLELDKEKLSLLSAKLQSALPIKYWYNGCGSDDTMLREHQISYSYLTEHCPGILRPDGSDSNCCFTVDAGGRHDYCHWLKDLYHCLLLFFK